MKIKAILCNDQVVITFDSLDQRKNFEARVKKGLSDATRMRMEYVELYALDISEEMIRFQPIKWYQLPQFNPLIVGYSLTHFAMNMKCTIANFIRIGLGENVSIIRNPHGNLSQDELMLLQVQELAQLIADKSSKDLPFIVEGPNYLAHRSLMEHLYNVIKDKPEVAEKLNLRIGNEGLDLEFRQKLLHARGRITDKMIKSIAAFKELWKGRHLASQVLHQEADKALRTKDYVSLSHAAKLLEKQSLSTKNYARKSRVSKLSLLAPSSEAPRPLPGLEEKQSPRMIKKS